MNPTVVQPPEVNCDALGRYVASVEKLHTQIHRIQVGEIEIAGSLSRAAAALRSIASVRMQRQSEADPPRL